MVAVFFELFLELFTSVSPEGVLSGHSQGTLHQGFKSRRGAARCSTGMAGMLLAVFLACVAPSAALVVSPAVPRQAAISSLRLRAARDTITMQVEAPVKIPDKVPNFAPAKPDVDKANQKAKKHKLLLFNDNVNK